MFKGCDMLCALSVQCIVDTRQLGGGAHTLFPAVIPLRSAD